MADIGAITSASQLALIEGNGNNYELIAGELTVMSPAGGRHGKITQRINKLLANHVDDNALGVALAETGFLIAKNPDTLRAPDGAFISQIRWDQLAETRGYLELAPDLAIEVISPNDRSSYIESKVQMWLQGGTHAVLVIDPENETVRAYLDQSTIQIFHPKDSVDLSDVVPGWKFKVSDIFD
jgi:Uma2 family endonuclease